MIETFIKKYPMWVDAKSFIGTVAAHCNVEAVPIAEYRRFVFFIEYKFSVKGLVKNLKNFERYAHVSLRKTSKNMRVRRKVFGGSNGKVVHRLPRKKSKGINS
jgi:hypothetical protein